MASGGYFSHSPLFSQPVGIPMIKLVRVAERIADWVGVLAGTLVVYTVIIIVFNVVARYVFRSPPAWGFDAMVLPMGCAYALGGVYALRHQAHVNVDILIGVLKPRMQAFIRLLVSPFFLVFLIALVWAGTRWAYRSYSIMETSGGVGWLLFPFKATLAIGALLFLALGVIYILRDLFFVVTGDERYAPSGPEAKPND